MKPKEKADQNGRVLLRLLVFAACFALPLLMPGASGPAWWTNQGVLNGKPPNDFAVVNEGQAKTMAVSAVNELNENLSQFGGAGTALNALAIALTSTTSRSNDYCALNLGQFKALIQPF